MSDVKVHAVHASRIWHLTSATWQAKRAEAKAAKKRAKRARQKTRGSEEDAAGGGRSEPSAEAQAKEKAAGREAMEAFDSLLEELKLEDKVR